MDETIPPGLDDSLDTMGPIEAPGRRRRSFLPGTLAGAGLTLGLHVSLAAILAGLHALPRTSTAEMLRERLEEAEQDVPEAIKTRLVKLGRARQRGRLPDRITKQVAALAPDQRVGTPADIAVARSGKAPSKAQQKAPEKQVTPEDLAKTLERAKILGQVGDTRSTIGSPEGVRDGEIGPDEASALDLYVTLLHRMIRQRWSAPSVIPAEELAGLRCVVSVQIQRDLTIGVPRLAQSSGNATFDASAIEAVERFRREVRTVPPPPDEEVANAVFGRPVTIRFRGRGS